MDCLLFRLYAPMASWGEIAVGETRHTATYPSKSAIIGLMAAALGVDRNDEDRQRQIQQGYATAVEVYARGALMRDYHTTQVPDSVGRFRYRTRRDELVLGKERLGTILSTREYRSDSLALVAVRAQTNAPYDLQTLQNYLKEPRFHLYLGRKSCPLAAPMDPQISENVNNFYEAFNSYHHRPLMPTYKENEGEVSKRDAYWLSVADERHFYWEGAPSDFSDTLDLNRMQTRVRHDQPLSRKRWQFSPRREHYYYWGGE